MKYEKKYKLGHIYNLFGLKKYGAEIKGQVLYFHNNEIDINKIEAIMYGPIPNSFAFSYGYYITSSKETLLTIPYTYFSKDTFITFFKDLKEVNNKIEIDSDIFEVLNSKNIKLKADFKVHKGNIIKNDAKFAMSNPALDDFLGLSAVILWIAISVLSYFVGTSILMHRYPSGYAEYRNIFFVLGGISIGFSLVNVITSLTSTYLGHKVTFGFIILASLLYLIALI